MGANGSTSGLHQRGLIGRSGLTPDRRRAVSGPGVVVDQQQERPTMSSSGSGSSAPTPTSSSAQMDEQDTDSDSSNSDSSNSGSEIHVYNNRREDLISVFQQLVRNDGLYVFSTSDDDESDGTDTHLAGLPAVSNRPIARVPRDRYIPDLERIQKNDITLQQRSYLEYASKKGFGLPQLMMSRELGNVASPSAGFDKPHRTIISSRFLPNSVRRVALYGAKAFCGSYSKDGDSFLSASQDRSIRLYDTSRGRFKELRRILARDVGWSVLDTGFSPDGRYVAYSSWSESIHIVNLYGDTEEHEALPLLPETRRFCIFSISFSDDGTEILGGSNDGCLYVYDRQLNRRVSRIFAHGEDINSVAFADETSNILFSAADDGLVKVWDRRSMNEAEPRPVGIMAGHIDGITYVESKKDGRYILTNCKDQSMKLWDMRAFSTEAAIDNAGVALRAQNWDYRWQRVPKKLCVPRHLVDGDTSVMTYRGHSVLNTLIRCHFSPAFSTGQQFVYTGCAAGRVVIYDLLTGKIEQASKGHRGCVRDVSWHPFLPEMVSASWDNTLGHWTYEGKHAMTDAEAGVLGIKVNEDDDPPVKRPNLRRSPRNTAGRFHTYSMS